MGLRVGEEKVCFEPAARLSKVLLFCWGSAPSALHLQASPAMAHSFTTLCVAGQVASRRLASFADDPAADHLQQDHLYPAYNSTRVAQAIDINVTGAAVGPTLLLLGNSSAAAAAAAPFSPTPWAAARQ